MARRTSQRSLLLPPPRLVLDKPGVVMTTDGKVAVAAHFAATKTALVAATAADDADSWQPDETGE
ncbi:MAG: hypothetical protein AAFZ01_05830 [Pseudomonadota bacterium]